MENFDPDALIKYLKESEGSKTKMENMNGWVIRLSFMLKFGLDENDIDQYLEKLNKLIESKNITALLGYCPELIDKNFKVIRTLEEFEKL